MYDYLLIYKNNNRTIKTHLVVTKKANNNYIYKALMFEDCRKYQKFFAKPRIKISNKLKKNQISIILTEINKNPESFVINVWTLEIENTKRHKYKILSSKNAYLCSIFANILENKHQLYDNGLSLLWNRLKLSTLYNVGSLRNDDKRKEYIIKLPSFFLANISQNPDIIELGRNTKNDILLFFTLKDSNLIYLISSEGKEIREENISQSTLPFNKEFEIQIRFTSSGYSDMEGKSFKFIANSWDNIQFESKSFVD